MKRETSFGKWMLLASMALLFLSCRKDGRNDHSPVIEKDFTAANFTKVYSTNGFNIVITKGTGFHVKAKGPATFVNDMEIRVINGVLDIQYRNEWRNRPFIDVFITMPALEQFNLSGAAQGNIEGFENEDYPIKAVLSGASKGVWNGTPVNVSVDISGGSQLDITGITTHLHGTVSGGARLHAYNLLTDEADLEASGGSEAWVRVSNSIYLTVSGGSRIYYKGDPVHKHFITSGGGQVIKQ